jgi:hypothetical protein
MNSNLQLSPIEVVRFLRTSGKQLRVHGNGFIQLDFDEAKRFHFWGHSGIPRQVVPTPIHDHTFFLQSKVLRGRIVNLTYGAGECPAINERHFAVLEAFPRKGADTQLEFTGVMVSLAAATANVHSEGDTYTVQERVFHETVTRQPAVTLMTKLGTGLPKNTKPRVLIECGRRPDNDFNRNSFPQARLWELVAEIFDFHGEKL